ncbi:NAD(P)/FAD-dependent oxidoreductase [Microbacterium album]|uniref:Thioredoxin reductase n=1 Tax=Microbacterium album TaxID=2053191 RepID=A0A917IHX2_9MICO|nr:NAD(P)/FAD-dependent oxidoreductase [Microbacterium album]GGH50643.1 thioredoxin reductase [Microbacterium album]
MGERWDAIVIGGGMAGLSAALMLGRARRAVLVVDAGQPRNRFAAHMHGVLGAEGTAPDELRRRGRAEAAKYGARFRAGRVERVDVDRDTATVRTEDGDALPARAVVVASGMTDRLPEVDGLGSRWGKSVLHCPYCHGWEVRDRRIGVLATSELALHQAELVRQWSDRVVFFAAELGTLEPDVERRLRARGVDVVTSPVVEVAGEGDDIATVRTADGAEETVEAIFTIPHAEPHDGFLSHLGIERAQTRMGSFLAVDTAGRTSVDRIWAVGNVVRPAANVPACVSFGATTGIEVNMALVTEDFDRAAGRRADAG